MNPRAALALLVATALPACGGCGAPASSPSAPDAPACLADHVTPLGTNFFTDISEASGIRAGNFVPNPPSKIPINDHSRLTFADLNGDGFDDIVASSLFPNPEAGVPFEHLVFLNNGDGTFRDFSDESGLRHVQAGVLVFADVDNDGDEDCFAGLDLPLGSETSAIYLNDGRGHFTLKANSGVEALIPAANAVFADFDDDGKLDLFVGMGGTTYAAQNALLLGHGDGTFTDVSERLGAQTAQPTNGTVACDYDNDGDQDVFAATYGVSVNLGLNHLFQNDRGYFTDVGVARGFASLATGNYWLPDTGMGASPEPGHAAGNYMGSNAFGIDCVDVNNDGLQDIFLTAISHPVASDYSREWSDPSQLLINQGPAKGFAFVNEFLERGLPFNEGDVDGSAVDFDNDGLVDLAISRDRKYEGNYTTVDQKAWFGLMHQLPSGMFESVGMASGINDPNEALHRMKAAQNHAWADIDGDGDLDLLVGGRDTGGGRPNFLFRNEIGSRNAWLAIHVVGDGRKVNRDGIGTRVSVVYADKTLSREVRSSRGTYSSADSKTLHFGLGGFGCDFTLRVRWPDGTKAAFGPDQVPLNHKLTLTYPDGLQ